jgi:hypothetical protein
MAATYEVIELTSGNVAGDYSSEQDALARLRLPYDAHGTTAIANLSLMRTEDEDQQLVAMQDALVNLIRRASTADHGEAGLDGQIVAPQRRR